MLHRRASASRPHRAATELPEPEAIASADELYLAGLHLAQYRHATRSPEPYWEELLRRDPFDSRGNVALGERRLRSGRLDEAERHLRAAIARETRRNPNPATGEAHYLLGLVLMVRGDRDGAYGAIAKSLWNAAWRVPARLAMARLDAAAGRWPAALANAEEVLRLESEHLQAIAIGAIALRRLGREDGAERMLRRAAALDPLDLWIRDLLGAPPVHAEAHHLLDLAGEYAELGLEDERLRVLDLAADAALRHPVPGAGNALPLVQYHRAEALDRLGRSDAADAARAAAREVDAGAAFPGGLVDALVLERALARDDADPRAHALLGHWQYFHRRYDDAVRHLEASAALDPDDAAVHRGLGLAAYNVAHDGAAAAAHYERALALAPADPKLLVEADQLARRNGAAPDERERRLAAQPEAVGLRDDLTVAWAELLTLTGTRNAPSSSWPVDDSARGRVARARCSASGPSPSRRSPDARSTRARWMLRWPRCTPHSSRPRTSARRGIRSRTAPTCCSPSAMRSISPGGRTRRARPGPRPRRVRATSPRCSPCRTRP